MNSNPIPPAEALPRIKATLDAGRPCRLVVTGTSMLPFLRDKQDAVILTPITGEIRRDDILFYLRSPQVCVLHRVWQVNEDDSLLLCGDAQTNLEPVRKEQVLARVDSVDRKGRLISCQNPGLRFLVRVWQLLHPFRPYLLAAYRRIPKHSG